jgi:hypothetical protein
MDSRAITLRHNLVPDDFMWLWAKYTTGFNPAYHCTNCITGRYSEVFSKARNPCMGNQTTLYLDEQASDTYRAVYLCGVAKQGYSTKKNYPLNLHAALVWQPGAEDTFGFLNWNLSVRNARFIPIPDESQIPAMYRSLPPEFVTCRIFRWASVFFGGSTMIDTGVLNDVRSRASNQNRD